MTATDTTYVDVEGHRVRVRRSGPESAEPVLLLHGIGRSLEDWQPAQDLLARDHRVTSIDLPGFGLTRRMKGAPGLAGFARAVVAVLDALGERRPVHVMGNSLGGAVAMALAAEHPARVASLVLANSAGFGREVNVALMPMAYNALGVLPVVGRRFRRKAREAGIQSIRDLFHDPSHVTDDMLRHAGKVSGQPDFLLTFLTTAAALGVPVLGTYPWWRRALLAKIAAAELPTIVVWGDADTVLPSAHLEAAVAVLPHASSHLFPDTGHMPQIERAEEFAELASRFVAEAVAAR